MWKEIQEMTSAEKLAKSKPARKPNARHGKLHCRLRELRVAAGLTQVQVAKSIGITQPGLSQIEKGGETCLTLVLRLSILLDVDAREIWKAKR